MVNLFSLPISSSKMYWFKNPMVQKKNILVKKAFYQHCCTYDSPEWTAVGSTWLESLSTHLCCYLGSIKNKWKTEVTHEARCTKKRPEETLLLLPKLLVSWSFPRANTRYRVGRNISVQKDSRDLAETQEMEHHHLEANTGKAEASPSDLMNVCGAFIAFQEINE